MQNPTNLANKMFVKAYSGCIPKVRLDEIALCSRYWTGCRRLRISIQAGWSRFLTVTCLEKNVSTKFVLHTTFMGWREGNFVLPVEVWCSELTSKINSHADCFWKELVIQWKGNNLRTTACLMGLFQVPQILIMKLDTKNVREGNLIWRCVLYKYSTQCECVFSVICALIQIRCRN